MADRIGVLRGTAIRPSVSKNKRLYTRENIGVAVERANARMLAGDIISMYSSHEAARKDNVLETIGRITKLYQREDGSVAYEADVPDTTAGKQYASLVLTKSPYAKGVSIRGKWTGPVTTVEADGQEVTTAPGLEIFGIDATGRPGVEGAGHEDGEWIESAVLSDPDLIFESTDDELEFFSEMDTTPEPVSEGGDAPGNGKLPYGNVAYADPGYQADKKKRYALNTAKRVRAAWSFINQSDNAAKYTSPQVARMKTRIKAAAKKFDINVTEEATELASDLREVLEAYVSHCISTGGADVSVSGYSSDTDKTAEIAARVANAAIAAINVVDPDDDGDVDTESALPAVEAVDNDDDMSPRIGNSDECPACNMPVPDGAIYCPTCGNSLGESEEPEPMTDVVSETAAAAAPTQTQEAIVATESTPAAAPAPSDPAATITESAPAPAPAAPAVDANLVATIVAVMEATKAAAAPAPAPAPVAEAAPVVPEAPVAPAPAAPAVVSEEDIQARIDAAVAEAKAAADAEAIEALQRAGVVRKGFSESTAPSPGAPASEAPEKTLEELAHMTEDDLLSESYTSWAQTRGVGSLLARADEMFQRRQGF